MAIDDRPDEAKRLQKSRESRGFDSAKDAAAYFGWNYTTYSQHERGERGIGRAAGKYAKAFRVSEGWLLTGEGDRRSTVPLVGKVGAGPDGSILFAEGQGNYGDVPMQTGAGPSSVAGEVVGDSMRGTAHDGWLIYWDDVRTPPGEHMLGELCVVGLPDGRVLVKWLYKGSAKGLFNLESASAPTLRDVVLDWAALVTNIVPRPAARRLAKRVA